MNLTHIYIENRNSTTSNYCAFDLKVAIKFFSIPETRKEDNIW